MPLVKRTRAILRKAEFGFLGVMVFTVMHTPRLNGEGLKLGRLVSTLKVLRKAGPLALALMDFRGRRIN